MTSLHLPGFGVEALGRELAALTRVDSKGVRDFAPTKLFRLFDLRADAWDESARRIAGHEGGHTIAVLSVGTSFERVQVNDGNPGVFLPRYPHPDFALVGDVAGAIGEETLLGDIAPSGCRTDMGGALRKSLLLDGGNLPAAVERVKAAIEAARNILIERRVAHTALVDALLARGRLTRADCLEIVKHAEAGR